jgi:uncharacterized OB-fold protein
MQAQNKMIDEKTGRYLPVIYPEELPFWEAARSRQIKLQRCSACSKAWYPIGPACPHCFSMKWEWAIMSGRGTLHNYVVYHKAWTKWFESRVPYAVIQVQLEEGPRLTANLVECDVKNIKIGTPVEPVFEDITDDITLIQFRPRAK